MRRQLLQFQQYCVERMQNDGCSSNLLNCWAEEVQHGMLMLLPFFLKKQLVKQKLFFNSAQPGLFKGKGRRARWWREVGGFQAKSAMLTLGNTTLFRPLFIQNVNYSSPCLCRWNPDTAISVMWLVSLAVFFSNSKHYLPHPHPSHQSSAGSDGEMCG